MQNEEKEVYRRAIKEMMDTAKLDSIKRIYRITLWLWSREESSNQEEQCISKKN